MFNSAMIASLEDVASALEVTCDEVMRYLETQHWKFALDHGATKNATEIAINMKDWLEFSTYQKVREDIQQYKNDKDNLSLNTCLIWIMNKIQDLHEGEDVSFEWLGIFENQQEEINVLKSILAEV